MSDFPEQAESSRKWEFDLSVCTLKHDDKLPNGEKASSGNREMRTARLLPGKQILIIMKKWFQLFKNGYNHSKHKPFWK